MSNKEKPVYIPPTNIEIQETIEHHARDLVLCILNDRDCYPAYYNRVKQTTLWKKPRPLKQGSWDRLLSYCSPKLPQCKSYFKDGEVRKRAIELLIEHHKIDCQEALEYREENIGEK